MQLAGGLGQLTYCTNIHPGEALEAVLGQLSAHLPAIRKLAAPNEPFGLGLRLAQKTAEDLDDPLRMQELQALLAKNDTYVFTINAFPFGSFHGSRVKEQVYAPDWSHSERLSFTNRCADHLASLLPGGTTGSISTVPGTFKAWAPGRIDTITQNLVRHAAHLVDLERSTGKLIALALEPEPCCFLETIEETVSYFKEHLYSAASRRLLNSLTGLGEGQADDALHRHLGVCYDVCHAAVEYENARDSIAALQKAGIAIPKLQLSAALRIPSVSGATANQLAPFDEPVYLHQVIERNAEGLRRYVDLPDALSNIDEAQGREWRIHFHVPIFLADLEHFSSTQDFLAEILALHKQQPISPHLEVETYTWDVLPAQYRGMPVSTAIAGELNWVREQLS